MPELLIYHGLQACAVSVWYPPLGRTLGKEWMRARRGLFLALSVSMASISLSLTTIFLGYFRRFYWFKCRHRLDCQRMAVRHQNGLLFRRMVAKPAILLLGNRRRRSRWLWFMAFLESCNIGTLGDLRAVCRELFRSIYLTAGAVYDLH